MPLSKLKDRVRKRYERAVVRLESNPSLTIADIEERKQILSEIARHEIETPVTAGQKIAATKELNLMEHVYEVLPPGAVQIQIVHVDRRGGGLIEGKAREISKGLPSGGEGDSLPQGADTEGDKAGV